MQTYFRIRKVRICFITHCISMDWKAECKRVMCGDNKPFYLGHLNTCRTLDLSRFCLIVPSLTLMPDTAENIHRQPFLFFLSFWTTHFLSGLYSISFGSSVVCSFCDSNRMSHLLMSLNQTVDTLVFTSFRLPNITARHLIRCNTLQETDLKKKLPSRIGIAGVRVPSLFNPKNIESYS